MNKTQPPPRKSPVARGIVFAFSAAVATAAAAGAPADDTSGWVRLFYAGTHTDSKGNTREFSRTDLDKMVENHQLWAAPAVIGHPTTAGPRYATLKDVKRDGDNLFGRFHRINAEFKRMVQEGQLPDLSLGISLDEQIGPWINHVAFLGDTPPALTGLDPMSEFAGHASAPVMTFAADSVGPSEYDCIQADLDLVSCITDMVDLFARMRDQLIETKGVEAADKVIGTWSLDWIRQRALNARDVFNKERDAYWEREREGMDFSKHQPGRQEGQTVITQEQLAAEKQRADAAQAELAEFKRNQTQVAVTAAIDAWKAQGKVLPHQVPGMTQLCFSLHAQPQEFTFSKGTGQAEEKQNSWQIMSEFMAALKPQIALGNEGRLPKDGGPQGDASNPHDISAQAMQFQKEQRDKGVTVTWAAAVEHVANAMGKSGT